MGLEQAEEMVRQIHSDWELIDTHHIERVWIFPNFESALQFVNSAGAICEEQDHHADFELGWGRVKAMIWTCLLYTSPSPRDQRGSRMPSSA